MRFRGVKMKAAVAFTVVVSALPSQALYISNPLQDEKAVQLAYNNPIFKGVGYLRGKGEGGVEVSCTATLLDAYRLVTAGHCFRNAKKYEFCLFDRPVVRKEFSQYIGEGQNCSILSKWFVAEGYNDQRPSVTNPKDMAVGVLEKPLYLNSYLNYFLHHVEWPESFPVYMAGFGGGKGKMLAKRAMEQGASLTPYYGTEFNKLTVYYQNWTEEDRAVHDRFDGFATYGDSGGPLLAQTEKGEWVLVGINAAGVKDGAQRFIANEYNFLGTNRELFESNRLFGASWKKIISNEKNFWRLKAAEGGNFMAQNELGMRYDNGIEGPRDASKAFYWFSRAAEHGDSYTEYNVGILYYSGRGVGQDFAQAHAWFLKSAAKGNPYAQTELGRMYSQGHGVVKNLEIARQRYAEAVLQNHIEAQYHYGVMVYEGLGGEKNCQEGYALINKAAQAGHTQAKDRLTTLLACPQGGI